MISISRFYPYHLSPAGSKLARRFITKSIPADAEASAQSVLIAGCSYGEVAFGLLDGFSGAITGIDEDAEGIMYAKMIASQLRCTDKVSFRTLSPLSLRFDDSSFDAIYLNGVLSANPKHKLLKEMLRVLKPGGSIGIADSYWLGPGVPEFIRDVWESERQKVPTKNELESLLAETGYSEISVSDSSRELAAFYAQFREEVKSIAKNQFEGMKHKKTLVKHYKHEIDVYLKNGGDKWMGYFLAMAKKPLSVNSEQ
jgi:SAM-dependent methyltransferase